MFFCTEALKLNTPASSDFPIGETSSIRENYQELQSLKRHTHKELVAATRATRVQSGGSRQNSIMSCQEGSAVLSIIWLLTETDTGETKKCCGTGTGVLDSVNDYGDHQCVANGHSAVEQNIPSDKPLLTVRALQYIT